MKKAANFFVVVLLLSFCLMPTGFASLSQTYYNEGMKYSRQGNYRAALAAFTRCIDSLENNAPGYGCFARRAAAQSNLGAYDAAIQDATEAIKRYSGNYSYGHYVRGHVYREKKEYDAALMDLQKALAFADKSDKSFLVQIYYDLGRTYYGMGVCDQAISNFQLSLDIDPQFASGYWYLGNAHKKAGNTEEAIKAYENFIQYAKDADSRVNSAKEFIKKLRSP